MLISLKLGQFSVQVQRLERSLKKRCSDGAPIKFVCLGSIKKRKECSFFEAKVVLKNGELSVPLPKKGLQEALAPVLGLKLGARAVPFQSFETFLKHTVEMLAPVNSLNFQRLSLSPPKTLKNFSR